MRGTSSALASFVGVEMLNVKVLVATASVLLQQRTEARALGLLAASVTEARPASSQWQDDLSHWDIVLFVPPSAYARIDPQEIERAEEVLGETFSEALKARPHAIRRVVVAPADAEPDELWAQKIAEQLPTLLQAEADREVRRREAEARSSFRRASDASDDDIPF